MNKTMKQYKGKVLKAMMMLLAVGFALAGTSTLSSCSSDDEPYFTASEDDNPRILNTDLADSKIDRKTNYKLEIKVTPVHYTTVTWLLDGTKIAEGTTIDQLLPIGNHELKIVATTTKGKTTSRTLNVTVTPAADDPVLGTNANELIHTNLFRPPHGHMRWMQYMVLRHKYQIVMWDLVTRDYSNKLNGRQVLRKVKHYVRNGSIITFHDSIKAEKNMKYALPRAIEWLLEQGYEFKVFD